MLVRKYLWNRAVVETTQAARGLERYLQARSDNPGPDEPRRFNRGSNRPLSRILRRFQRGQAHLVMLKDGQILQADEDPDERDEKDWAPLVADLAPGFQDIEFEGERWMVLLQPIKSPEVDHFAIIRPWSPTVRLVRTLVLYQVLASLMVTGLALGAVSIFASRLARPLEELRNKTKTVGKKPIQDLTRSAVVEISDLQSSFLDMSHRVEEAMSSQRRFVADASHELKTPLTAIAGMLEILQSRPDMEPEDREQAITVARTEADRMASLISDLLLLSRAQAKRSGEKTLVNLADVVREQLTPLQYLFPEQKFAIEGDTSLLHAINDKAFSRICRNLMENAARYAGSAPVRISLAREGNDPTISFIDQGPGIPLEKQTNLFERFYRTDAGRARSEGGHGLGLAIVKALVEEAGGSISCRSQPGQGAEFKIVFQAVAKES